MTGCIFGGADIYDYSSVHIPEGAAVFAADGGYRHCVRLGIKPDCIIGDFDSYTEALPDDCEVIKVPSEKDETDLILAVNKCIERNITDIIIIYGADGGRMGHTVANIQTLSYMEDKGLESVICGSGFEMRVQSEGKRSYHNRGFSYVSLFSLTADSELSVKGLKYGGSFTLTNSFPMGVSNEFIEEFCEIDVKKGRVLVILER